MTSAATSTLEVRVLSQKGEIWSGKASSVSSSNSQGPFDLLPEHAHFVSLIEGKPITIVTEQGEKSFTFKTAVIRLFDDLVLIYADI